MKTIKTLVSRLVLIVCFLVPSTWARGYDHSLKADSMEFHWKVAGKNLAVKVSAPTEGWVGVGFNPVKKMKGANFILGFVKGGRLILTDDYGIRTTGHTTDKKRGGIPSILSSSGTETGGVTTIEFEIPLDSGDLADTVIDPKGRTVLLLGYGQRDSIHIGHDYNAVLEVNLDSGSFKLIKQAYK